jgi:hypothetical protein
MEFKTAMIYSSGECCQDCDSPRELCGGHTLGLSKHLMRGEGMCVGHHLITTENKITTAPPTRTGSDLRITIVYIHVPNDGRYCKYARRFAESYSRSPAGLDHSTIIVENGNAGKRHLFDNLPNVNFLQHDNSGYDIGGFQKAARECGDGCDLMVFFGASTFLNAGWLKRMVESFQKHGNALYGAMGNRGNVAAGVWPHIRTTAFWMSPSLMNSCPVRVTNNAQRHPFEHGPDCFTGWVQKNGLKAWVVTANGEYEWKDWDAPEGFHNGTQSALLAGDHICERPHFPSDRCLLSPSQYCAPWRNDHCFKCLART